MPAPTDYIVVFDGVCNLCSGAVQFILRHDVRGVFTFAAVQSATGQGLYREHGLDPARPETFLVLTPAGAFTKSDAAVALAREFGGAWRLLALVRWLPKALRDRGYGILARHRYRWFGKRETCLIPTPELRARFWE